MPDEEIRAEITQYGFNFGSAEVTRRCVLPPGDRVVIGVKTPFRDLDIYISATGRSVRIFATYYDREAGHEFK